MAYNAFRRPQRRRAPWRSLLISGEEAHGVYTVAGIQQWMVLHVGLDDTDSLTRMCTTYVATELLARVRGLDPIGYPRLVRLNPNIPWKTRGNGALCLRLGLGRGAPFPIGRLNGKEVMAYPRSGPVEPNEDLYEVSEDVVMELADFEDPDVQPGLVVTRRRPGPGLYWKAVRDVVPQEDVEPLLDEADYHFAPRGTRGLIGALASISWRPRDTTYEVLAYRSKERWGTRRLVKEEDVMALDERFPSTFNNYDFENRHVVIAPSSPCPVLLGIRGDVVADLPRALLSLRSEPVDRWLLFETNQATDEHLIRREVRNLQPHTSAIVEGTVGEPPRPFPGGHVVFQLEDNGGKVDCVAYEPSKAFRRTILELRQGDKIRAYGSIRDEPRSINLEKLEVLDLPLLTVKIANPRCPSCRKSMKSVGRAGGFRCRRCGTRAPAEEAPFRPVARNIRRGIYEPPVSARRHLSKPIKRIKARGHPALVSTPPLRRP